MKMAGEIIEVSTNGESITIVIQAKINRGEWKPIERQTLRIDNTVTNRRSFYLGRKVSLELKP